MARRKVFAGKLEFKNLIKTGGTEKEKKSEDSELWILLKSTGSGLFTIFKYILQQN